MYPLAIFPFLLKRGKVVVDNVFQSSTTPSGLLCILGIYAFAFQIYCDFSGYSNIARGLAKMLGIELMRNFNHPYLAKNPQEFWQRWHISLSTWLRDYLYIPLGGNRNGHNATYRNLSITMFLGGIWHGAAWTFIWWGVYQGILLIAHKHFFIEKHINFPKGILSELLKRIGMFHLICFGWLIFRANNMGQVGLFLKSIFSNFYLDPDAAQISFYLLFFAGILILLEKLMKHTDSPRDIPGWNYFFGPIATFGMILAIFLLGPPQENAFLYFQF